MCKNCEELRCSVNSYTPTTNPDSVSSRQILELFRALNRDTGQTILMVTHELEDTNLVDRVIWLADGAVVERGG